MLRADQARDHVPAGFELGIVPHPHGDADGRPSSAMGGPPVGIERFDYGADIAIAVSAVLELRPSATICTLAGRPTRSRRSKS
jgi:hypothetical protein